MAQLARGPFIVVRHRDGYPPVFEQLQVAFFSAKVPFWWLWIFMRRAPSFSQSAWLLKPLISTVVIAGCRLFTTIDITRTSVYDMVEPS